MRMRDSDSRDERERKQARARRTARLTKQMHKGSVVFAFCEMHGEMSRDSRLRKVMEPIHSRATSEGSGWSVSSSAKEMQAPADAAAVRAARSRPWQRAARHSRCAAAGGGCLRLVAAAPRLPNP